MITITTRQLMESRGALQEMSNMQLPVRTALKLRKMYRMVQNDLESTQETLKELSNKHAKKDGDGKPVHPIIRDEKGVPKEEDGVVLRDHNAIELGDNKEAFDKEFKELMDTPVDIPFEPIAIDDLADPKDPPLKLKLAIVVGLDWLFKD